MKIFKLTFFVFFIAGGVFFSCGESEKDDIRPTIDISINDAFPLNCDTVYTGETFHLVIGLEDNTELGSYSVDIHNNFDHHSHSTETSECEYDPVKSPVDPFTLIKNFPLPEGLKEYTTDVAIDIPSNVDTGDYHMYISLVDKEGWQTIKILSIKIYNR